MDATAPIQLKGTFNPVDGQLVVEEVGKRSVFFPSAEEMKQLWKECGGDIKKFVVHFPDPVTSMRRLVISVAPNSMPVTREDFCRYLARKCSFA